ncbi:MAG: hypothetical protein KDA91_26435, partial [Planctomycetaceae bacterium]|nr:hypothetical protein [Planctomycetaceae bacterium]
MAVDCPDVINCRLAALRQKNGIKWTARIAVELTHGRSNRQRDCSSNSAPRSESSVSTATLDRSEIERIVRGVLNRQLTGSVSPTGGIPVMRSSAIRSPETVASATRNPLVVNISARHVHLTQEHVEILFGKGSTLTP